MDTDKHRLIAFVAVLISIVLLTGISATLCALARPYDALGVGGGVAAPIAPAA